MQKPHDLQQIAQDLQSCQRCDLYLYSRTAIPGDGDPQANLMIIGESPSEHDEFTGKPFSGPSGRVLDSWLHRLGLTRGEVWLTNVVKHRSVDLKDPRKRNRAPTASEYKACSHWLRLEISIIRPKIIVALGASAGKALLGSSFKISRDRGKIFPGPYDSIVIPTYHTAYILKLKPPLLEQVSSQVEQDLDTLKRLLSQLTE